MVRPHVDWMTRADDTILEFLRNGDNRALRATPAVVEANVEYGISHVRTRLRRLHEAGLVEYYDGDRGIYEITSLGTDLSGRGNRGSSVVSRDELTRVDRLASGPGGGRDFDGRSALSA